MVEVPHNQGLQLTNTVMSVVRDTYIRIIYP